MLFHYLTFTILSHNLTLSHSYYLTLFSTISRFPSPNLTLCISLTVSQYLRFLISLTFRTLQQHFYTILLKGELINYKHGIFRNCSRKIPGLSETSVLFYSWCLSVSPVLLSLFTSFMHCNFWSMFLFFLENQAYLIPRQYCRYPHGNATFQPNIAQQHYFLTQLARSRHHIYNRRMMCIRWRN